MQIALASRLRLNALCAQSRNHFRAFCSFGNTLAQSGNDGMRRPCRRQQAEPADGLVMGQSCFAHGGDVGKRRGSCITAHGQRLDRSRLDERHHSRDRSQIELRFVGHGSRDRRRSAFVRHVHGVIPNSRQRDEHGDGKMAGRAGTAGRVVEPARLSLGERNEIGNAGDRQRRAHHQHVLHHCDERDGLEILDRIIAELGGDDRSKRMGGDRSRQQSIAVGRRACDRLRADLAAGAAAIVDHDRRAENGGHFGSDDAHDRIIRSTRRVRRDQPDGTIRIALRERGWPVQRQAEQKRCAREASRLQHRSQRHHSAFFVPAALL
jgi:hypothetical protein